HRNELGPDALHHADFFERRDAAVRERQVDRAPGRRGPRGLSRIGTALEKRHAVSAPRQEDREERAGETRADERDLGGGPRRFHESGARDAAPAALAAAPAAAPRRPRNVCNCPTTAAPSPMAAPTRFTEPLRTSPTAKMPSTPVSSDIGPRSVERTSAPVGM